MNFVSNVNDDQLMKRIAQSDSSALGMLYDRYGRLVFSLVVIILGDAGTAEEVTQDVFVQIWNKAGLYNPQMGKVSTWLTRIARNRAIDMLRRHSVRPEGHQADFAEGIPETLPEPGDVEQTAEQDQDKSSLLKSIATLPEEQRRVLALAYFDGLSHQEIAELLGEPLGTVKTRLRLAMQKLRQALVQDSISAS